MLKGVTGGSSTVAFPGTVTGGVSGGIPYFTSTTGWASSALLGASAVVLGGGAGTAPFTDITNLVYAATGSFGGGPQLQVGSGATTLAGLKLAYISSGYGAIWSTGVTASGTNFAFTTNGADTILNSTSTLELRLNNANQLTFSTSGITATPAQNNPFTVNGGTASADGAILSVTRTNNNAAVATGVKIAFTDTASAAGFLPLQVLGGASATTNLISVDKSGNTASPTFQASLGTALTLTGGAIGMSKMTASGTAPGATGAKLEIVAGTNAGTAKLIMYAGTSGTAVTIIDNVGAGVT